MLKQCLFATPTTAKRPAAHHCHLASCLLPTLLAPTPPSRPPVTGYWIGTQDDALLFQAAKDTTWGDLGGYTDWASDETYKAFKVSHPTLCACSCMQLHAHAHARICYLQAPACAPKRPMRMQAHAPPCAPMRRHAHPCAPMHPHAPQHSPAYEHTPTPPTPHRPGRLPSPATRPSPSTAACACSTTSPPKA